MKNTILLAALILGAGLTACDKTTVDKTPDTVIVPVPVPIAGPAGATGKTGAVGEKGASGQSGNEGIQGKTGKTGDEGIQGETGKTGGNTTIIVPPPVQNPSSVTP